MEILTPTQSRDNSYHALLNIGAKQLKVLEVIRRHGPISAQDIARYLRWNINQVTGRITELREQYVAIYQYGLEISPSNVSVCTWKAYTQDDKEVRRLAIERRYRELNQDIDALQADYTDGFSDMTKELVVKEISKRRRKLEVIKAL